MKPDKSGLCCPLGWGGVDVWECHVQIMEDIYTSLTSRPISHLSGGKIIRALTDTLHPAVSLGSPGLPGISWISSRWQHWTWLNSSAVQTFRLLQQTNNQPRVTPYSGQCHSQDWSSYWIGIFYIQTRVETMEELTGNHHHHQHLVSFSRLYQRAQG